ncbi:MAG: molybdopterin molybdotransferase MoeA [Azospirillaceae bacterium]
MIPVAEARDRILAGARPLPAEILPVTEVVGRVLARPATARRTQPWADLSAMDGYAVRVADVPAVPTTLRLAGEVKAGGPAGAPLAAGTCQRIFTGAPVPPGADAIVIQEDTERTDDGVVITELPRVGRHIRKAGNDFVAGAALLPAGHLLRARDVGLLAAMNLPWLAVHRRPRVAILSTGDEIVLPGEPIGENQLVSANGPALSAFVRVAGGDPLQLGIAGDSADELDAFVDGALGTDLLITTGGASVGAHDLVREVLLSKGMVLDFWRIAMRPGKPLMFGQLRGIPVLGLPGNPVSAQVCAMLFALPLLRVMQGLPPDLPMVTARLDADMPENDRREDYVRATLRHDAGDAVATPLASQDSAQLSAFSHADCLIVRPPFDGARKAGAIVPILRFDSGLLSL